MIETLILYLAIIIVTFIFMEGFAWFLHKYVMHGFGWFLHEDHHRASKGRFEKNDVYSLFFSFLSFILILAGYLDGYDFKFAIGIGVTMYGIGYFLFHDIFFHRRVKLGYKPKSKYMKRILYAHRVHHQKSKSHQGVSFGFLWASKKYSPPTKTS